MASQTGKQSTSRHIWVTTNKNVAGAKPTNPREKS
jgi:hypothetical protein